MTIQTNSAFRYGHTITTENQYMNFMDDGINELSAILSIGSYSFSEFAQEVARAFNDVTLTQEYTTSINYITGQLTISSIGNFDLLVTTGTQSSISAYSLAGFVSDSLLMTSHTGANEMGFIYEPQFVLQKYVDFEDQQRAASSKVNQSANGQVIEVVQYGIIKEMECNITFATNIVPQEVILDNPNGVDDLRAFMVYGSTKAPLEFIPDIDNAPEIFVKCLLESTPQSKDGTAFRLKELYPKLTGYFETGKVKFRQLN